MNAQSGASPSRGDLTGHGGLLADSTVTQVKRVVQQAPLTSHSRPTKAWLTCTSRGQPSMMVASAQRSECTAAALMLAQKRLPAWALQ